jgi:hypothetical protein
MYSMSTRSLLNAQSAGNPMVGLGMNKVKWRAREDYSVHPCASPLRGQPDGLFKIVPDNFVEPERLERISQR